MDPDAVDFEDGDFERGLVVGEHEDCTAIGMGDLAGFAEDHLEQATLVLFRRQRPRDLEELLKRVLHHRHGLGELRDLRDA